jgi:uncharacterized protein (TIGR03435 family)
MASITAAGGWLVLLAVIGWAQTDTVPLEFEVASIKPYVPQAGPAMSGGGKRGGPGTSDPGQVSWDGVSLKSLITTAYAVKVYQVSGPEWLDTQRFSIVAKVPAGTTQEQVRVMWQNLLAQRFRLAMHRETREIAVYEIEVGKNGPKLKESAGDRSRRVSGVRVRRVCRHVGEKDAGADTALCARDDDGCPGQSAHRSNDPPGFR